MLKMELGINMTKQALFACIALSLGSIAALPAHAETLNDGASKAVLASPASTPMEGVIDGRIWRCAGATCVANANDAADVQKISTECHRAAKWLGQFTEYQTGPKALTASELTACNANVTTKEPHIPG